MDIIFYKVILIIALFLASRTILATLKSGMETYYDYFIVGIKIILLIINIILFKSI